MRVKKLFLGTMITTGIVTPLVFAITRKKDLDLDFTKNIVVISEEKNENGIRSFPMDKFWESVIKKFKIDYPMSASKFNIVVKHGDQSAYEELSTIGVTGQDMPDLWFFPSNRLPFLIQNGAINKMTENDKQVILSKSSLSDKTKGSFESYLQNDYAARFKMETVFFFMNKDKLKDIYNNVASNMVRGIMDIKNPNSHDDPIIEIGGQNFLVDSSITIDELFIKIENNSISAVSKPSFEIAHNNVAKFFADNLDIKKVAKEMKSGNARKKYLLPFNGANKWWANSFIYATGEPKKGGLIWEQNGKPTSQLMKLNDDGAIRDVMQTYFDISVAGPKDALANDGTKKHFETGGSAFTISGTWDNDRFIDSFENTWKDKVDTNQFIEDNLFSIGLPMVRDTAGVKHQLKHYVQGKSLGVNSRNNPTGKKSKAILELASEIFTDEVHQIYYDTVESFVPSNSNVQFQKAKKSYINSVLKIVSNDSNRTVPLSEVSNLYEEYNFGKIWEDITHPLAADLSGNIGISEYKIWAQDTKSLLQNEGFVEPNNE